MKIVVVEDGVRTELAFAGERVRIGRSIDNDIRLSGHQVSRHHAQLEREGDAVWAMDLGSSNGTEVNGERIDRRRLEPGERVRIGRAELSIEIEEEIEDELGVAPEAETTAVRTWAAAARPVGGEAGLQTLSGEARRERENLRVFAAITRQLLVETDLSKVLREIVDSAIELVGGERGFLLLGERPIDPGQGQSGGDLALMKVRVARSYDREDIPVPASRLSMGIARRVAATREPLLSVDAGRDGRFDGMASVEDLRLRSVLCLPLTVPVERGERVDGVLYIDNRLQPSAFSSDSLDLLTLLADQASIAIRNARLLAELREQAERVLQSSRKIELLNDQLGRKVRDRDHELAVVRAELTRERGDDVTILAESLITRAAREAGRPVPILPREVLAALLAYDWPGNVRELENEMRRLVVLANDIVGLEHLSPAVREGRTRGEPDGAGRLAGGGNIKDAVADLERRSIEAALEAAEGNKSRAAASLGISRFALQRKLDKYAIGERDPDEVEAS